MIDAPTLLADTKRTVGVLIEDLRTVAATEADAAAHIVGEYRRAHAAGRTAFGPAEWAEGLYAQVAVAWTLGCVFIRFCEDNDLIVEPLLGGPGLRAQLALDQRAAHLQLNPADDDRHWLREVFRRLRCLPATGEIFGTHNPIWLEGLLPSADGARRLREDLTRIDPGTGQLRHDYTDPSWDTRFLGDLYQDLSEHAKKTFALLQTPVFVEEFILDRTLEPAIATFGIADTTLIDPTCGSGHFLLGAFERIFHRWVDIEPATNRRALAQRALDAIGGIDLNPFAASIARFRLLLAALRAGGDNRLADAPSYDLNVAVGDSLLHGDPPGALPGMHIPGEEETLLANHGYAAEDHLATRELLDRGWSAVVGNPPYIAVADSGLRAAYKSRFPIACSGKWTLGMPFIERFWQLGRLDTSRTARSGYIGMITDNSFMKREKGKKLIEQWLPTSDLTHVLDTSGVPIPGHGTGSVILLGRSRAPVDPTVRTLMKKADDPHRSAGERSPSWQALLHQVDAPGTETTYFSCADLLRLRLYHHPWSIGGGGAAELKDRLDRDRRTLGASVESIGITAFTLEDDAFLVDSAAVRRLALAPARPMVEGDRLRDWTVTEPTIAIFPYTTEFVPLGDALPIPALRHLWRFRTRLANSVMFGARTKVDSGLHWTEFGRLTADKLRVPLSIAFAHVATHNHFALDRGGKIFNRSAPVIKLAADEGEDSHLELLGVLNSSTACFWLKQVAHPKGGDGVGRGIQDEAWETRFDFDATKLLGFPLPADLPRTGGALLDSLATQMARFEPTALAARGTPSRDGLDAAQGAAALVRGELIAAQERLDWECYRLYGLVDGDDFTPADVADPPLALGERAFEIALARRMKAGEEASSWFARHGSTPITEVPTHWPAEYRALIERRIDAIEVDPNIGLIERPEHKRRWVSKRWEERVAQALRHWLLGRLEDRRYWPDPASITTIARLTAEARFDEDFVQVARLYADRDDIDLASLISGLTKGESVAYLAAYRYTDPGLRKFAEWRQTWDLQRQEDVGDDVPAVPVPPKYAKPDFAATGWELRGKLDVPKERFISYPGAQRETDASAVIGWAGWNHLERARALAAWYLQARRDGRYSDHLVPMLAGLAELVPWLKQWHDEPNADPSLDRPGSQVAALVETETRSLGLTAEDLVSWRPPAAANRGRPRKATA